MYKYLFEVISDEYKKKAISLKEIGLNELAWNKNDIFEVIEIAVKYNLLILGGDVYERKNNKILPTYDSWYCEKKPTENIDEFMKRAKEQAISYIKNFDDEKSKNFIFTITITEKGG